ncbi:MAG: aldo/keto reductase [Magnetococcales bacterium]|nr:aldo/keto reductase [Magnetococcales bacterium]
MKLGLGTVQFGMDYGITNHAGQPSRQAVGAILEHAAAHGVRVLDTACQYGGSEEILGSLLPPDHPFRIVTKTPAFSGAAITPQDADHLEATFSTSLAKLRARRLHGLLIHSAKDLAKPGGERLFERMQRLQQRGQVERIGVSVYSAGELAGILDRFPVGLVQTPVNILDQRWLAGELPARLRALGVEVHARSIFLQGVLLSDPDTLPPCYASVRPHLRTLRAAILERGLTPLSAALCFVRDLEWVDVTLCGVVDLEQLRPILAACGESFDSAFLRRFAWGDEAILNPSLWVLS